MPLENTKMFGCDYKKFLPSLVLTKGWKMIPYHPSDSGQSVPPLSDGIQRFSPSLGTTSSLPAEAVMARMHQKQRDTMRLKRA